MTLSIPDADFDIQMALPAESLDASPDAQVWMLLCAHTLLALDPDIDGVRADDVARALMSSAEYRELDAEAAAYLWLSRIEEGIDGEQVA